MARKGGCLLGCGFVVLLLAGGAGGGVLWVRSRLAPPAPGPERLVRLDESSTMLATFQRLGPELIRDPALAARWARFIDRADPVGAGTYRVRGGERIEDVITRLRKPLKIKFRFPETNWARRSAGLLEKKEVCRADEYLAVVSKPSEMTTDLPVKKWASLEGVLFPDTYEFAPSMPAEEVVAKQLAAFERKVFDKLPKGVDLKRLLTVASLVELEVGSEKDRPLIAGVIENRLKQGMPLQIDASLLYGIQKWRRLYFKDYRELPGPYNLYRVKGLPPTPICSPSWASVQAALRPAETDALYYVAIPGKGTVFSKNFEQHKERVRALRRAGG